MRKALPFLMTILLVAALATYALAGMKEHDSTKLPFGASYHKSPAGMNLNYLRAE
jgi:hypothetical protein